MIAIAADTITTAVVSISTCMLSWALLLPITFLIPTSLLLVTANAVERLMKLIQAINIISNPINASVYKEVLLVT